VLDVRAGWRHQLGEGKKLGRQAKDAVMVGVYRADSHTADLGWVFPQVWLSRALVMTSRPSVDELKLEAKMVPGLKSICIMVQFNQILQ
jgi:hypothetical protein